MSENGRLDQAVSARRRAGVVSGLRGLTQAPARGAGASRASAPPRPAPETEAATPSRPAPETEASAPSRPAAETEASTPSRPAAETEVCDLCGTSLPDDHRHLLALVQRRIVCACEACWAMRSGEGDYRPTGQRTLWLAGLDLPDDLWASFQVPIGLAFFMESTVTSCVVAMYPSPGGATESELHFDSWARMRTLNPVLEGLEPDIEGLIVNRLSDPPMYLIAPIDRCYELTGTVKARWEGISGGPGVEAAVSDFLDGLRAGAVPA